MEIKNRIINVLNNVLGREVTITQLLEGGIYSLGIHSLVFLKIVVGIEEEFDIMFDDNEINYEMFRTFEDFCDLIERKTKEGDYK
ncbi:MAG: acyl carrier protein [Christensenellaceae bacterium]|jgi:acyl carrier protein|nr:acyl carrier protein [Christensenellaceae bacterium]